MNRGPGDETWGSARCQPHSSSQVSCSPLTYSLKSPVLMGQWERSHTARAALAHQPAVAAQVQAQKLRCRDEHGGKGRLGALPRQDTTGWWTMTGRPWCSPGAFVGATVIKGTQRSESPVSLCWKLSPPPKPYRLAPVLERGMTGVGEVDRQAAR